MAQWRTAHTNLPLTGDASLDLARDPHPHHIFLRFDGYVSSVKVRVQYSRGSGNESRVDRDRGGCARVRPGGAIDAQDSNVEAAGQQVRGMATEKQILNRITGTSNIAKITKSMKMVSAAKMRGAENRMNAGRPFTAWLDNLDGKNRVIERDGFVPAEELEGDNTFVVVSSDRGLCGGINSGIAKAVRKQLAVGTASAELFVIGDKGRAQLRRDFGNQIRGNVTETFASPPNFTVASAIAEGVVATAKSENEKVHIVYNKFQSAIAYLPSVRSLSVAVDSESLAGYELEPDNREEVLADLKEFEIASAVFQGLIENSTSEESSRMSAMENATTNAQELISSLTLVYNKARQSRITTELIEIISGAASLDAK